MLQTQAAVARASAARPGNHAALKRPHPLEPRVSQADIAAHRVFIAEMGAKAVWNKYWPHPAAPELEKV